jgi:hypothetical protein
MSKMVRDTHSIKKLAKWLNFEHGKMGLKWREIASDYPGVNFATLNRIAKSNGAYIPKSPRVQELLGIAKKPRIKKPLPALGSPGWEKVFFKKLRKGNQGSLLESIVSLFERLRKGK